MIFNYGYGCCAFAHNICGSQPLVPDGIPNMSNSLPPEFFINPRCPSGPVPVETASVLEAGISEPPSAAVEVGSDNEPDSSARLAEESEEPGVSSRSLGLYSAFACRVLFLPMFYILGFCYYVTELLNKACVVLLT